MEFLRAVCLVILTAIRFRWILFINRKLIRELRRLSKQDPRLLITLKMSDDNPRKIDYDMKYLD